MAVRKARHGPLGHEVLFDGNEEGTPRRVLEPSMIWDTPEYTRARRKFNRAGHQLFLPARRVPRNLIKGQTGQTRSERNGLDCRNMFGMDGPG